MSNSKMLSRGRVMGMAGFFSIVALVFGRDLVALVSHSAGSEIHSHIVLVPFISAYLIYVQRAQMPRHASTSWWLGLAFGLPGIAAFAWARSLQAQATSISHNDYLSLVALAFVLTLIAGGFFFLGLAWMKAAAFALFFLIFAIPLPDHLVEVLETASKLGSAEVANVLFNLTGTPMVREGVLFQIPGIVIEVAQECSGIRSSWVLLMTSFLAAHMFLRSPWRRAILVLFVIPLGLVRNGFRILVLGLLCVYIGPEMIHSIIHRRGGPLFFALSLFPLFLLLRWLRKGDSTRPTHEP